MRRRLRSDSGATAVEFALVVPLVLTLLGGVTMFGLRAVHDGLASHAARAAMRTASLPVAPGVRAVDAQEVCDAAVAAIPAPFRPTTTECNPGSGSSSDPTRSAPAAGGLVVQVCPPRCDAVLVAAACPGAGGSIAAPLLRAQSPARARVVVLAGSAPSPSPSPTSTGTFGGLLPEPTPSPLPTPTPALPDAPSPTAVATAVATAGAGVDVPSPEPLPTVTLTPVPSGSPVVLSPPPTSLPPLPPLLPEPTPGARVPACDDLREGRRVAVRVSWSGAALRPFVGLTLGAIDESLTVVTAVSSGRRE